MTSLADQIRTKLDDQRWAVIGHVRPANAYELSDLGACHAALLAVLDEHQPCEPPRQLLCNGCHHMEPCPTKVAISAALGIKGDVNA